jgi:hypothetical protein
MSQEYNTVSKKQRRTRSPRNHPTLVTETTSIETLPSTNDNHASQAAEPVATIVENATPAAPVTTTQRRPSLLPNFFSKVDKSDQDDKAKEVNVIQARMARARKGVVGGEKTTAKNEAAKETTRATTGSAPAKATPNRPPSLFKTRHIIGMAIYLLAAQFILPYERIFAISTGIEKKLMDFPFFGFTASITTSFLLNIITLIVLLYLLVHFDLLPSGKKITQSQQGGSASGQNTYRTAVEKPAPKTIREGVKGEHDDLYMAYRNSQRREKKR